MSGFAVTPTWVGTFEQNQRVLIQNAWDRVNARLIWDKLMERRSSSTLQELAFWLLETARIQPEGQGGQKSFSSIAALMQEITNEDSGNALELTKNEISDNQVFRDGMKAPISAMGYAASWSKQMGGSAAYWPEEKMFALINAGEGTTLGTAYDDLAFFHAAHPVNPYDASKGTYANLLTGASSGLYPGACPIDSSVELPVASANLAKAVAYIESLTQPNGAPRKLRVVHALAGTFLRKRVDEILDTKFFGQDGSTENVVSRYGIEPLSAAEITSTTDYYLACEQLTGEGGGLIFQDREPYILSSYGPATLWELQRTKKFVWSYDGRNAAAYGHPYLFFKVKGA
jgi:hypothetical protein